MLKIFDDKIQYDFEDFCSWLRLSDSYLKLALSTEAQKFSKTGNVVLFIHFYSFFLASNRKLQSRVSSVGKPSVVDRVSDFRLSSPWAPRLSAPFSLRSIVRLIDRKCITANACTNDQDNRAVCAVSRLRDVQSSIKPMPIQSQFGVAAITPAAISENRSRISHISATSLLRFVSGNCCNRCDARRKSRSSTHLATMTSSFPRKRIHHETEHFHLYTFLILLRRYSLFFIHVFQTWNSVIFVRVTCDKRVVLPLISSRWLRHFFVNGFDK